MKHKRLLTAALAASLAVSSLPAALALDTAPPMYQQFGYDSEEAYTSSYDWWFDKLSYDQASDCYRRHLDEIHNDPSVALRFHDAEQSDLEEWLDSGYWDDREAFYRSTALDMTLQDDFYAVPALSVQLSGKTLTFPDVQPFFENGRTMVPFRAVAEALGAEVGCDSGTVSASLGGKVCRFAIGGDTLTVSDRATGKVLKTVPLDTSPIEKDGRTCVPVRFLAESLGLTVEWDDGAQCAVLYDRDALLESIDSGFTTANRWLAAVPRLQNADAVRMAAETSCDAVMIARGAEGTPWLFSQVQAALAGEPEPAPPTVEERIAMARRHAHLLAEREGRNIVRMRKHAMWYMAGLPGAATARGKINACITPEDFDKVFDELLAFAAAHDSAHNPASSAFVNKEAN